MNSSENEVLTSQYLKVYHASSAYIDMDYRKPLDLRDAARAAVYADLVKKQTAGISMTFILKNHRTYTDGIMKKVESGYRSVEKTRLSRLSYWSITVTACLGIYILARLTFLDIGGETPFAMDVTPRRIATFLGLLVTLELVSLLIRKGFTKKAKYLSGILLVAWIAMVFPVLPFLGRFTSEVMLFRLNLSAIFVCSLAVALASYGTGWGRPSGPKRNKAGRDKP